MNEMKRRINITILLSTLILNCFSQTDKIKMADVIPPSPHVRNFLKYGETPVSNYTGVPSIEIPIHTIQLKDITFPINISYNASGIKVEEEASRVGLGWVLNAGGMISVTMMGAHHDFAKWAYFNDGEVNKLNDITGVEYMTSHLITGPKNMQPFSLREMRMDETTLYKALSTNSYGRCGGVEVSPDIYNYNVGLYSGKFIFSHSGKIIKEKEDNVQIIPIISKDANGLDILKSWKAVTPDGTIYYFDTTEKTTFTDRPKAENYNSCYYLSKIESINGSIINLNYKKTNSYLGRLSKTQDNMLIGSYMMSNYAYYEVVCLDNITYSGGKVRFEYKYDREDYAPEPKLTAIYIDDESGLNKSKWTFEYGYFISNQVGIDYPTLSEINKRIPSLIYYNSSWNSSYYTDSWNKKRLQLKEFKHTNGVSIAESYSFKYNEANLPTKLSTSIDHWGYNNGALNYSLVPTIYQNISQNPSVVNVIQSGRGAIRKPNPNYNQSFLLQEIEYPTGGVTKLSFESNSYDGNNFENDPHKKDYMYDGYGGIQNSTLKHGIGLNNAPVDWVQTEPIKCPAEANSSWKAKMHIKVKITLDDSYNSRPNGMPKFEMSIVSKDGKKKPWSFIYEIPHIPSTINNSNRTYERSWEHIEADFDDYEIRAVGTLRTHIREAEITVQRIVATPQFIPKAEREEIGGGLRVARIENYDSSGEYISGKVYKYVKGNPTSRDLPSGETSGKLMFYPRYRKNWQTIGMDGLRGGGYSVGYSTVHVVDFNKNKEQIGRILYEYTNIPDLVLNYSWANNYYPYRESKDESPTGLGGYTHSENGTLLKETQMLLKKGVYQKQQEVQYDYSGLGGGPYIVWGILKQPTLDLPTEPRLGQGCYSSETTNIFMDLYGLNGYDYTNGKYPWGYLYPAIRPMQKSLRRKVDRLYEEGGIIETITDYTYNQKEQLIKESIKSNSTILKIIDYKYPPDITTNAVINKLTLANRINLPIETKETIGGQTSHVINDYSLFNNIPQLSVVKSNTGVNRTIESRITYHLYDKYGNPRQISKDGTANIVYIWSYKGQYPIAEIKNATYEQIENLLTKVRLERMLDALAPSVDDMKALDNLRNNSNLKAVHISSYTYKPSVGIISMTDPSSKTIFYDYDSFGRLKEIYFKENNIKKILEAYDYKYSN